MATCDKYDTPLLRALGVKRVVPSIFETLLEAFEDIFFAGSATERRIEELRKLISQGPQIDRDSLAGDFQLVLDTFHKLEQANDPALFLPDLEEQLHEAHHTDD